MSLIIIAGVSGSGKTTITNQLLSHKDLPFKKFITYTTRKPRSKQDEDDYIFLSKEDFLNKINNGDFFEWTLAYNNYYGSAKHDLEQAYNSNDLYLIALGNANGVKKLKQYFPRSILIFIDVEPDIIKSRLLSREMPLPDLISRLNQNKKDILIKDIADAIVGNNGDLEIAVKETESKILAILSQKK